MRIDFGRVAERYRKSVEKGRPNLEKGKEILLTCAKDFDRLSDANSLFMVTIIDYMSRVSASPSPELIKWRSEQSGQLPSTAHLSEWPREIHDLMAHMLENYREKERDYFIADLEALIKQLGHTQSFMILRILQNASIRRLAQVQFAGLPQEQCIRVATDPLSPFWLICHYHLALPPVREVYPAIEEFVKTFTSHPDVTLKQAMMILKRILKKTEHRYSLSLFSWLTTQLNEGKAPSLLERISYLGPHDDATIVLPLMELQEPLWGWAVEGFSQLKRIDSSLCSLPFMVASQLSQHPDLMQKESFFMLGNMLYELNTASTDTDRASSLIALYRSVAETEHKSVFNLVAYWIRVHGVELKNLPRLVASIASIERSVRAMVCTRKEPLFLYEEDRLQFLELHKGVSQAVFEKICAIISQHRWTLKYAEWAYLFRALTPLIEKNPALEWSFPYPEWIEKVLVRAEHENPPQPELLYLLIPTVAASGQMPVEQLNGEMSELEGAFNKWWKEQKQ